VARQRRGYAGRSMRLARRPILFILLALLTLAVQQGALRHELSHELASRSTELRDEGGAPPAPVCEGCLAYAGIGAALLSCVHLPSPAFDPPPLPGLPPAATAGAAPRAYLARAPPSSRLS
jgi:hypothetical protein